MKKIITISLILFLIIVTTITKNSTKELESEIYLIKENLSFLKNKYSYILLEYNYLTTPKKLMEYQSKYFEKDLIPVKIDKIKNLDQKNNKLIIENFNKIK